MVRAVRAKVRANKKYDFAPDENTILVRAKIRFWSGRKKKYDFGPGEISPGHEFIKNTISVRAKIRFWSGRKYTFGPGEISPGHEF